MQSLVLYYDGHTEGRSLEESSPAVSQALVLTSAFRHLPNAMLVDAMMKVFLQERYVILKTHECIDIYRKVHTGNAALLLETSNLQANLTG